MPTVGEQLKAAREAQRLTVTQVADITKIRSDHIRAIDAGNYDVFSAPVYIRGFVRTYATALKLDTTLILAQLNAELAEGASGSAMPSFQAPAAGGALDTAMYHISKTSRRSVVPVILVVLVVGATAAGIYYMNRRVVQHPLDGLSPGLYDGAITPGETLPLPKH